MINGNRVRQVRELCGWTQAELAHRLSIKQPTLAQIEIGSDAASARIAEALAKLTDFRPEYFKQPEAVDFPMGSLLFRAHAAATSRQRTEAYRHAQLLFEIRQKLAEAVNEYPLRLPRLGEDPSLAARIARAEFGLSPDKPLAHLINTLEKNGVIIFAIPVDLVKRDAFSLWAGDEFKKPVIAVCSGKPGDRMNWNVAHELAHLILHQPAWGAVKDLDRDANCFAAEFLLPEAAMRQELVPPVTIESVGHLKLRWKVAMQALIRRAHELDIITERQYRYLFEQIGWKGWRIREPLAIPAEKPRALRKMAEVAYGVPINYDQLSSDTMVGVGRLKEIMAVHAAAPGELSQRPVRQGGGNVIRFRTK